MAPLPTRSWHRTEATTVHASPWWFGGFYNGDLDQIQWTGAWNPTPLLVIESPASETSEIWRPVASHRRSWARDFSPDLSVASYTQYDTDSNSVGVNARLRWTFRPVGDLFIVYNHNIRSLLDRWQLASNQLLVKMQYAWRL